MQTTHTRRRRPARPARPGRSLAAAAATVVAVTALITVPTAAQATPAQPAAPAGAAAAAAGAPVVPVAPFVTDVIAVGLGVAVSWNPSPTTEAVTGYTVTATPKTTTVVAGCTPVAQTVQVAASDSATVVAGLCAKVLYVAKMTASNAAGTSPATAAWTPVAPLVAQVPTAPAVTAVTARNTSAIVSWAAPVDTGGLPVTGYQVTATPTFVAAGTAPTTTLQAAPDARSVTVTGLTNATKYTIDVVAVSSVGPSAAGSITVTPLATYAPSAPTGLTATPGGGTSGTGSTTPAGTVTVSWAAPADNGGAPVTGYTVTWQQATYNSNRALWRPATGSAVHTQTVAPNTDPDSPDGAVTYTVPAADFEQPTAAYLFTVTANNTAGTGTGAVTPAGVSPTVGVKKTTVVLTAASLNALTGVDATTLTWANPAPTQVVKLKVGQVLVADTTSPLAPAGFLRTITAITTTGGTARTNTVISTGDAALPDAFGNAALSVETNPAAESVASQPGVASSTGAASPARSRFTPAMAGVSVAPHVKSGAAPGSGSAAGAAAGRGVGFSQPITVSVSASVAGLGIKGAVTITPSVAVDLSVSTGAFGIPNGARLTATAKVSTQQQLTWSIKGEHSFELGHLEGPDFRFYIGPVPVIITTGVDFSLVVSGEVAVVTSTSTVTGAQLSWNSANPGKLTTVNLSTPPGLAAGPGPTATTYTGTVGLRAETSARLYGVVGPYIAAELDLQTEINFHPAPGDPYLTVGPVLNIDVGLSLASIGINLADTHATLSQTVYPAYQLLAPLHPAYTITSERPSVAPGNTLQLTATRTDGGTATKTWTLLGGTTKDKISSSGLFIAGPTINRTVTAVVRDNTGAAGQTSITIGTSFDPPGNPRAVTNPDGTTTVTWTPPANTGGSPVKSYTVLTTPDTGARTVAANTTSVSIPGVPVGAYVAIYASNFSGRRSAASTTIVAPQVGVGRLTLSGAPWAVSESPNGRFVSRRLTGTFDYSPAGSILDRNSGEMKVLDLGRCQVAGVNVADDGTASTQCDGPGRYTVLVQRWDDDSARVIASRGNVIGRLSDDGKRVVFVTMSVKAGTSDSPTRVTYGLNVLDLDDETSRTTGSWTVESGPSAHPATAPFIVGMLSQLSYDGRTGTGVICIPPSMVGLRTFSHNGCGSSTAFQTTGLIDVDTGALHPLIDLGSPTATIMSAFSVAISGHADRYAVTYAVRETGGSASQQWAVIDNLGHQISLTTDGKPCEVNSWAPFSEARPLTDSGRYIFCATAEAIVRFDVATSTATTIFPTGQVPDAQGAEIYADPASFAVISNQNGSKITFVSNCTFIDNQHIDDYRKCLWTWGVD